MKGRRLWVCLVNCVSTTGGVWMKSGTGIKEIIRCEAEASFSLRLCLREEHYQNFWAASTEEVGDPSSSAGGRCWCKGNLMSEWTPRKVRATSNRAVWNHHGHPGRLHFRIVSYWREPSRVQSQRVPILKTPLLPKESWAIGIWAVAWTICIADCESKDLWGLTWEALTGLIKYLQNYLYGGFSLEIFGPNHNINPHSSGFSVLWRMFPHVCQRSRSRFLAYLC